MDRGLIDAFEIQFKFALRNLKSAILLSAMLFALSLPISAQQPAKIPVIGRLGASSASGEAARMEAFRQGLRELGYIEGKNIVIEWRHAEGKLDRLPVLAGELVRLKVDIIITGGGNATEAAMKATSTIPIVMAQSGDPVADGFVASLARPGGNITGLSRLSRELSGKRLELLKEIVPKLSRVAVFGTSTNRSNAKTLREVELAAPAFGVKLQYRDVLDPKDYESAFRAASKGRAEAILVEVWGPVLTPHVKEFAELAVKNRLPAMYVDRRHVEAGGLMNYGVSEPDLDRRTAAYVEKILKGRQPADLPVEQPTKFEFIINLKAAKQIGLTIPPNVLARADRVIK
jgi:putative tryptophan/tyrosine transport system substrate-binding protein